MQHAQEATAEAKAQGIGVFRLEEQGGIVQGELFQRIPKIVVVIRADREQARVHLGLHFLEARQHRRFLGVLLMDDGVAHRRAMDVLDASHHKAHVTGFENVGVFRLRVENTHLVRIPGLAGGLDHDLVTLAQGAFGNAHQRDHAQVVIEPGVDDQRLQRRFPVPLGGRNLADQIFQHVFHAHAALGTAPHGIGGLDADHILDLFGHPVRLGLGQVHLVQDRHHFQALLDGGVTVGY